MTYGVVCTAFHLIDLYSNDHYPAVMMLGRYQKSAVTRLETRGNNDMIAAIDLLTRHDHFQLAGKNQLKQPPVGLCISSPLFTCPASYSPHVADITAHGKSDERIITHCARFSTRTAELGQFTI